MLARAFFDDPLSVYLLPDEAKRARVLPWLYERTIRYGTLYGDVFTTGEGDGVAVWLPPGAFSTPVRQLVRAGLVLAPLKFGLGTMRRLMAADHVERLREKLLPDPHWYLWQLGVEPEQQGRGIGGALIGPVLQRADASGLPCYLETHKERNVTFYRRHGFEVIADDEPPGGVPHYWILIRHPGGQ
jgi:ribosomal protein S18 acetylase RimI-like enzyme